MEDASRVNSPSGSSSDQPNRKLGGWERFLPRRALRILLVEDDTATLQVVNALLSKCGYEVSTATDGLKAWELLTTAKNSFDLVLADVMMPLLSGTDLLVKIISSEVHKDIPVIMMSSQDSLDMVFKCLLKGAKDFLVKPLRKNELRNLWQHVWRRNHASAGVGNKGDNQGRKRKALKSCTLSDLSNDNFSVSTGVDAGNVRENENAAQVSKQELSPLETKRKSPSGTLDLTREASEGGLVGQHKGVDPKLSEDVSGLHSSQENSEASRRLGKAFDFIGNMAVSDHDPCNIAPAKEILEPCQDSCGLDLTLRRTSTQCDPDSGQQTVSLLNLDGQQGVQQSSFSAFSKYISSASFSSVPKSAALPTEPMGCNGPRPTLEICPKANERGGSSTLHFPKAIHIHQSGTSPFSLLASYRTEHGKRTGQDNYFPSNKSPSLNSSTVANSLVPSSAGTPTDVNKVHMQKESHINTALAGPGWCSTGSDKEDHGSNNVNSSQPSCSKVEWAGPRMDEYALQQQTISNEYGTTTLHDHLGYRLVSGRASNDGSDRGSCLLDEQMTGKSINGPSSQEQHSFGGAMVMNTDDNSMMACYPSMSCNEGSFSAEPRPSAHDHRSSFREAALHKFREKRKMRCFEKKVRYQSRKKLAEQRPRIKGQFVRRAVYDNAAEAKPTT